MLASVHLGPLIDLSSSSSSSSFIWLELVSREDSDILLSEVANVFEYSSGHWQPGSMYFFR